MSKSREAKTGSLVGREQAQLCGQMPLKLEWNLFISSRTEWGGGGEEDSQGLFENVQTNEA